MEKNEKRMTWWDLANAYPLIHFNELELSIPDSTKKTLNKWTEREVADLAETIYDKLIGPEIEGCPYELIDKKIAEILEKLTKKKVKVEGNGLDGNGIRATVEE